MDSYTNFPNGVTGFGIPLTGSIPLVLGASGAGKIYFVDPTNGDNANSGKSTSQALASVEYALTLATSGDTIALSTSATHSLAAGLLVTASRINFIGLDFFGRQVQQGAKVQLGGAIASAYVCKNTGVRNSFTNIKFIQASTSATALTVFQEGGEGTLFSNCSFVFGVADNLGSTSAYEFLAGSDSATYLNCTFGADTLLTTAARSVFHIDQVNGFEFKSNILENCNFIISSSSASANFIKLDAVGDVLFTNLFKNCTFVASVDSAGGIAMTVAVFTGTGTVKGGLYFTNPNAFNVTTFCPATSGGNANVKVVSPAIVATPIVAIQPTA